jgi:hypothetical protein
MNSFNSDVIMDLAARLGLASAGLKAALDNLPALLAALGVPAEKS